MANLIHYTDLPLGVDLHATFPIPFQFGDSASSLTLGVGYGVGFGIRVGDGVWG